MDLYGCNNYSSRLWNELKPKIDSTGRQEIVATEEIRYEKIVYKNLELNFHGTLVPIESLISSSVGWWRTAAR